MSPTNIISPTFGFVFPSTVICIGSARRPVLLLEDAIVARPVVHCLWVTQSPMLDLAVGRISGGGGSSVSLLHGEVATLPGLSTAWATWLHDERHVYA